MKIFFMVPETRAGYSYVDWGTYALLALCVCLRITHVPCQTLPHTDTLTDGVIETALESRGQRLGLLAVAR